MSLSLGKRLRIRALVYVAGEPIPPVWPMRTFIYHSPLFGLEHLPFEAAIAQGARLFKAQGFLPRAVYQRYLREEKIDRASLRAKVENFVAEQPAIADFDAAQLLMHVLEHEAQDTVRPRLLATAEDIHAVLHGNALGPQELDLQQLIQTVETRVRPERPVYAAIDELFGTQIGTVLDELVIKSCLDFFDEGQSVWQMPGREYGLFAAWSALARRNLRLFLRGLHIKQILEVDPTPEGIIDYCMAELAIPEEAWMEYFTRELVRLHGWAGFIRWRSDAKHYHWASAHPADLVDYLAVRMVLGLALVREHAGRRHVPATAVALKQFVTEQPGTAYLRRELHSNEVLPGLAQAVESAIDRRNDVRINALLPRYVAAKREHEARRQAQMLRSTFGNAGMSDALMRMSSSQLDDVLLLLTHFERAEGLMWLEAHEARHGNQLLGSLTLSSPTPREKRPFAQLLFCIDVRSERIRRQLERVGDYETYGIAGFFGVPVSFIGLDKGSETHLCPVVVTPKNLVLELSIARNAEDKAFVSVLEQVFHELKASVLSPFMTVEAIGLLFGLDMFGKTFAPLTYSRWRRRLQPAKPDSRLLLDKLTLEQADSIIRSLQRAMIVKAVGLELGIQREAITDEMVRELRETALGNDAGTTEFAREFKLDTVAEQTFIERLQRVYRINRGYARLQLERLGRIGFTLDEQVRFVSQALLSIGLTDKFSRFVLLTGHGSLSENNPYESALDCGACGGNHGLVNARVLAQMANKPAVRERLRAHGINIAADAWFIPALHNTTSDQLHLYDLDLLPPSHLIYLERLMHGLRAASRLCAAERLQALDQAGPDEDPARAYRQARRNALDWSQVRPEWALSRNAAFIIGRRHLTSELELDGRAFLHSYDYRHDPKARLLENILAGPLVVGQWINMDYYFSTVDNSHYGSGSKVYHNVAGRFGVMTGNLSDLRTGLPAQTVLKEGAPFHEPMRLLTIIEAPFEQARRAVEAVANIKNLVENGWLRMVIIDPETQIFHAFSEGEWRSSEPASAQPAAIEAKHA